jgi:hypothetical protein
MSRFLMGAAEIRQRLRDISRQRVYQLTQRSDWPASYDELIQGASGSVTMSRPGSGRIGRTWIPSDLIRVNE